MKKHLLTIPLLLLSGIIYCQVGINTNNPQAMLHVDGAKDNPSTGIPSAAQQANDIAIDDDGNVMVGGIAGATRLDLRSSGGNNIVGVGNTTQTAAEAGAGAIRYVNRSGGLLQVSNGVVWSNLRSVPERASVVARITSYRAIPQNTPTVLNNWDEVSDVANNFDNATGTFTAPRDGVYTFSSTFDFINGTVAANSEVETQFYKNGSTISVRCLKTWGESTREAQAGGTCVGSLGLAAGDTVQVRLVQQLRGGATGAGLRTNGSVTNPSFGFNNLTIVEQ